MKFKISQSALRDFYNPNYCKIKWKEVYVKGNRTQPTDAMMDGLVFEQKVIGLSRGGEVYEIPKLKNGKQSKRELDLEKLSIDAKEMIKSLDIEILDVQPEWIVEDLIGHPDCLITYKGHKAIMDLKYTAVKENDSCKYNPYAWDDLDYKDFRQALHYVLMYYKMHNVYLPFIYLVFGKSGWVKVISLDITQLSMEDYMMLIGQFRIDYRKFNKKSPEPIDNFSICRKCKLECKKRSVKPKIINYEL